MEKNDDVKIALLEQRMVIMERKQDDIQGTVKSIESGLNTLLLQVTEAKGGWKMLILLISMVGGFGAVIGFLTGKTVG